MKYIHESFDNKLGTHLDNMNLMVLYHILKERRNRGACMINFPFTAIVGQDEMKEALILNVINPLLRGVLICGQKGTAKSTAIRSLASLLQEIEVVEGCHFHCDPQDVGALCDDCRVQIEKGEKLPTTTQKMAVVDLPLGATEDRVIGTLDIEHAIKKGERRFQSGILAEANRGILYVDEVNLLDDHLVDILLDVAASGVNIVEREGISFSHPARVILLGTMNPEEGELRPQLLDRFGLCVYVQGLDDIDQRTSVVKRYLDFENDPTAFVDSWKEKERQLRNSVFNASKILSKVVCPDKMYKLSARMALDFGVDGHRTDLFIIKTARTMAAYHGNTEVTEADIQKAAGLVLPHRMKEKSFQSQTDEKSGLQKLLKKWVENNSSTDVSEKDNKESGSHMQKHQHKQPAEAVFGVDKPFTVRHLSVITNKSRQPRSGKRSKIESNLGPGKQIGSMIPKNASMDIAFAATFRAAAPYQVYRDHGNLAIAVEYADLREKRKSRRTAQTILFLVDASGSMGAQQRMVQTKGAVLSLLNDAYKKRDRVGMVTFNGNKARVILPPTADKEKAGKMLEQMPVGGRTPLAKGLCVANEALKKYSLKMKNEILLLIVISDGKANIIMKPSEKLKEARDRVINHYHSTGECGLPSLHDLISSHALKEAMEVAEETRQHGIKSVVIDTANTKGRDQMKKLSTSLGGLYYKMNDLRVEGLVDIVNSSLNRHVWSSS
ncbi:MAG: magnesium chelatase subunit D family protein [Desulfobacterales bacterium]|nr:magnesium chelatase subunit D family protein [Desulfobacterales bacterium]